MCTFKLREGSFPALQSTCLALQVCYIEYEPRAYNETVEVCRTPVMKDCQVSQPARRHVGGV